MSTYSGSCHCKSVTFTIKGDPIKSCSCYCNDCRKLGANPGQLVAIVMKDQFTLNGQDHLTKYTYPGGSGNNLNRYFCSKCGAYVMNCPEGKDAIVFYPALLDEGNEKYFSKDAVYSDLAIECYKP